jgi:hypothetical protein
MHSDRRSVEDEKGMKGDRDGSARHWWRADRPLGGFQAEIPGLATTMRLASRAPEWQELGHQSGQLRQAGKNYDDSPVAQSVGSDVGAPVLDAGFIPPL